MIKQSTSSYTSPCSYSELFESATTHQDSALRVLHEGALELLKEKGLPSSNDENYKRFDISTLLEGKYTYAFQAPVTSVDYEKFKHHCSLELDSRCNALMIEEHLTCNNNEDNIFFGSLKDFSANHPGVAERYLGVMSSVQQDPLTAFNTLLTQDVAVLFIPRDTVVEEAIHMIRLAGINPGAKRWVSPRLLIIAEENAQARLLSCDHATHSSSCVSNTVIEIYAGKGSHFELYDVEDSAKTSVRISNLHVTQEEYSYVSINTLTIQNGITRNNFFADLKGAYAELYLNGICILDGEQKADNYSFIRHSVSNCHSDEIFKYTLNDAAIGSFSGKIYVALDAQKTTAYQNNRNLLLSSKAKMYSKPHLEIYADDVKCSHGMTTGELDNNALFYMQQRGIPYVEAKLLLTIAFMSEVLEKIQLAPLRERLIKVVENRYRGLPGYCQKVQE